MAGDWAREVVAPHSEPALFDTSVAHCARVYNYWLGGKDNFAADRAAAEAAIRDFPKIIQNVRANRAFLLRASRFLALKAGIRQFLDIGTGIPPADPEPGTERAGSLQLRVVYVDNDPIVMSHARALLSSRPWGSTAYLDADLRDPERILEGAARTLDFTRPVAVLLLAVLHHIEDAEDPGKIVTTLMNAVPSGSYLVLSHPAADVDAGPMAKMAEGLAAMLNEPVALRTRAEVARYFDGLDMTEPGLVQVQDWRPDWEGEALGPVALWAGVARKP
jgi:hypothetical protein